MIRHLTLKIAALSALESLSSNVAQGQALTIINPNFDITAIGDGMFSTSSTSAPNGWSVYNAGATNAQRQFGILNPTGTQLYPGGAPSVANVGVVFLSNTNGIAEAGLRQTLSSTLQLNTSYSVSVAVGNIANDPNPPHNSFNFNGFPGYRIDLLAGSTLIGSDNNTLLPSEGNFLTSTFAVTVGSSHANAGQLLGIRLVNLNGPGIEVNFDDVRVMATPVPEPSSMLLFCAAVGGVLVNRRRRMHRSDQQHANPQELERVLMVDV